jgi:hypothetical protein
MNTLNEIMNKARLVHKAVKAENPYKPKRRTGGRYPNGKYNGRRMAKHRIAAEKALGRPLPTGVVIHHIDGNPKNYANTNLVICPDEEYHKLLHTRTDLLHTRARLAFYRETFLSMLKSPSNRAVV